MEIPGRGEEPFWAQGDTPRRGRGGVGHQGLSWDASAQIFPTSPAERARSVSGVGSAQVLNSLIDLEAMPEDESAKPDAEFRELRAEKPASSTRANFPPI